MNYPYDAYGSNVNSGRNMNANLDWGSYQWPGGVPSNLLGTARYQDVSLTVRVELVELLTLLMQFTAQQGYDLRGTANTQAPAGNWCWGYSNRAISGTNSPSNHSKGKAVDLNAPANPYTSPLVCDIPPAIVNTWEKAGWFWGGRYSGSKDAMHFEYCWAKTDVAGHVSYVKSALSGTPIPPDNNQEDDLPYSPEQLTQFAASGFARGAKTELLAIGDGPEDAPTQLTLERWAKVTNDRIWELEQKLKA